MNIHIEYCVKWNYGPEFDRVSKTINSLFPKYKVKGNDTAPRSGAFEVTLNQKVLFSKFDTGKFPTTEDIKNWFY